MKTKIKYEILNDFKNNLFDVKKKIHKCETLF